MGNFQKHIIQRRVYLEPTFLDQNIMTHLLTKPIKKEANGECVEEYGHILSVQRIVEIAVDNEETVFTLRYEAKTLKPEIGCKLSGVVCMVDKGGILIDV